MRTVLTGGTGVIGRASVTALRDAGHDVVVVTRSASGSAVVEQLGAVPVRGDVLDLESLATAYEGADAVVNLATKVPVGHAALVPGAWRRNDRLRTTGVGNVIEAARRAGVRRVVQESVSVLYAEQGDEWITEESPVDITPMTEPAAVGESLVQDYSCDSRVGVVLRFGTIVGDDPQTRYWLRATASGRRVGIGHPAGWAHVIHTDDLGGAVLASLHAPSGVYNVGAEPVQRLDLVQGYADAASVESGEFMRAWGRWLIGPRLEPLARSLRVSSDHFAAQTGWRASRRKFERGWFDAALTLHDLHR
ncbi:MAG: NAD(P)-dependent oxidoreductase [Marmoricola sp.]|nr:NAD(P)-dependent oxidoreductase [Marmoricola sp.]